MKRLWITGTVMVLSQLVLAQEIAPSHAGPTGLLYFASYPQRDNPAPARNPYLIGALFTVYWSDVETSEGVFDWSPLDRRITVWTAAGKKVALRIMWSSSGNWPEPAAKRPTPQFVLDAGAVVVHAQRSNTQVPLVWGPVYRRYAQRFLHEVARKFDDDPHVLFVDVTPGAETNPYRFRRINVQEPEFKERFLDTPASDGRRYSHKLWLETVKQAVHDARAAFQKTPLLVTLNVGSLDGPEQFQTIGAHCVDRGCYVGQNGLNARSYEADSPRKRAFLDWGEKTRLYFEMVDASGGGTGSLMDVMKAAERIGCDYLGVYAVDVLRGTKGQPNYDPAFEEALAYGAAVIGGTDRVATAGERRHSRSSSGNDPGGQPGNEKRERALLPAAPNLLILLTDDQRWNAMGCAGNGIIQTPEMDRLAREGTRFVNAFATSSICAASRASIFTGQYERTHRCNFHTGPLRRAQLEQSYPMLLRRAGYHTGFIGKYGVGDGPREMEGDEVFDRWYGFYGQGQYFPKTHPGRHLNAVMVEQARDFLDRAPAGKPWCLSISFKAPHSGQGYLGYEAEPELKDLYTNVTIPTPPTAQQEYFDALPEFLRRSNARTSYWQQRFSTPQQYQAVMKDYYRLLTGADRAIGRIRAELARRGMAENTVILFLSDNGDMVGDYLLGGKELLYDVSLRVPLIILDPRVAPSARGRQRAELALNIDLAPTVLDLAGAPVPAAMQGRSLAPLVRGEHVPWRQDFFCENNFAVPAQYYPMIEGVRTTRWKYVRYTDVQPPCEQLFDLEKDAKEVHNLAQAPEHASTLADLRRRGAELRTEASPKRPNIVFFLADDLGYGDLGCHGNPHVRTPQLDAFAREAVALANFHVSPVCSPTRASLMTGRYSFRTGVCDVFGRGCQMDPAEVTLAEALRGAGYATGIFGKWHLGDDAQRRPNAQGFDETLVHTGPALRNYFDPELVHNGQREKFAGYCMDIFTDHAIAFMRHNRARPFFLYLPANLIHTPLQVSDELAAPFVALGLGSQTSKAYGMVKSVDDSFGRVRATLKELGLEDNTLLLFASDNGPCSGSAPTNRFMAGLHGLKGTVYENGIRVPCFARWPAGFRSPAKVTRLTAHLDVMPTLLDACGVAAPSGVKLDGASLLPLLRNPAADWPQRTLFFQWDSGQQPRRGHAFCVLTEKWKLVQACGMDLPAQQHIRDRYAELCRLQGRGERSVEGPPHLELYDISTDPGETQDLAAAQPTVVETMQKLYETWFDEVCQRWLAAPILESQQP